MLQQCSCPCEVHIKQKFLRNCPVLEGLNSIGVMEMFFNLEDKYKQYDILGGKFSKFSIGIHFFKTAEMCCA